MQSLTLGHLLRRRSRQLAGSAHRYMPLTGNSTRALGRGALGFNLKICCCTSRSLQIWGDIMQDRMRQITVPLTGFKACLCRVWSGVLMRFYLHAARHILSGVRCNEFPYLSSAWKRTDHPETLFALGLRWFHTTEIKKIGNQMSGEWRQKKKR